MLKNKALRRRGGKDWIEMTYIIPLCLGLLLLIMLLPYEGKSLIFKGFEKLSKYFNPDIALSLMLFLVSLIGIPFCFAALTALGYINF